jgi:hypothetical protein
VSVDYLFVGVAYYKIPFSFYNGSIIDRVLLLSLAVALWAV